MKLVDIKREIKRMINTEIPNVKVISPDLDLKKKKLN